ncbi:peptidoglycan-binding protein [Altererythrobacter xixiisoli]|uniref:Peptidoglycan-binding protein n=1 Tax=Croceibacterium xixiisoli TaxID=1476466 RepID=A0A6I4TR23_9SPHN|nr:FecR domain-containing protein [Croceibacterium xixiisoli]MXO98352.1 peptidoglycan-binding protein [Croceibacterium xixiisoli]
MAWLRIGRVPVAVLSLVVASIGPVSAMAQAEPPEDFVYAMKAGDTLIGLAGSYFHTTGDYRVVQRRNRVADPYRMPIGSQLRIPVNLLRFTPVQLQVVSFSGNVAVASGGRERAPAVGETLSEGTVLQTGRGGFITLSGGAGSRVSLPSQSRVRVKSARRYLIDNSLDVEFELLEGRGSFQPPQLRRGERYRVRTPQAVSAVRGTTFRIFLAQDGERSGTEVIEGDVALSTLEETHHVAAGFGAVAGEDGGIAEEPLLPSPVLADPDRVQTEVDLKFTIRPVAGATSYRLQLARDAGFVDTIAETVDADTDITLPGIPNGTYFVRSAGIAASGIEGLTEAYSFRRQRLGVEAAVGPAELVDGFRFAWRHEGEGPALYSFRLWREGQEARPMLHEIAMDQREYTLTALPPGVYYWQVAATQPGDGELLTVWNAPQKLTITP